MFIEVTYKTLSITDIQMCALIIHLSSVIDQ